MDVPCFVGIEVAKAQGDSAVRPSGARWASPNDAGGVVTRVAWLQALHPTLMVLEATGGRERAATAAWATAGLPVVVVNPRQARDCARATGQLAKTEAWEARALAPCADVLRPPPRPLPDAQTPALRALLGRRQHLTPRRTAEQHRRGGTRGRLQTDIAAHRTWRNARLSMLANDRDTGLRGRPLWRDNDDWFRVPLAWAPCVPARCCWHCPHGGRSRGHRSRPWSVSPPCMVRVGPCGGGVRCGEAARTSALSYPGAPAWPRAITHGCKPLTHGSSPRDRSKKWP